jgi:hypothetical protein
VTEAVARLISLNRRMPSNSGWVRVAPTDPGCGGIGGFDSGHVLMVPFTVESTLIETEKRTAACAAVSSWRVASCRAWSAFNLGLSSSAREVTASRVWAPARDTSITASAARMALPTANEARRGANKRNSLERERISGKSQPPRFLRGTHGTFRVY